MSAESELPSLLIVDDDRAFREVLAEALAQRGFSVDVAADVSAALEAARCRSYEYALVDVRMPGGSGLTLVEALLQIEEGLRVVVFTGYGSIADAVFAMKVGAVDYLTKPVTASRCVEALLGVRFEGDGTDVPTLERVEWEYLQRVLSDAGGNVSDAARRLGMHRRTLQRKLAKDAPRK